MSIASELTKLLQNKVDIKKALESKLQVDSISSKLSDWPSLIYNIDIPNTPEEELEEELIQDEYTHIWILPTSNTTIQSFLINITGETTIDWGDGTTPDVLITPGLLFALHVYSSIPTANATNKGVNCINYTIVEIKIYSEYDYSFEGQGATPDAGMTKTNIPAFNTIANTMLKFIASDNCLVKQWGFAACNSLSKIKLSEKQTEFYTNCFSYFRGKLKIVVPEHIKVINNCFSQSQSIREIVLHDSLETLNNSALSSTAIEKLEIPASITYIGNGAFGNCKLLKEVIWKSPYKFILSSLFTGCYNLELLDLSYAKEQMYFGTSTGTTGTSGNVALVPNLTKIVVPKSLYNSWKSNTKWIYFKDYLYWKDENGNLQNIEVI